jgi:segregation and condensation protein B
MTRSKTQAAERTVVEMEIETSEDAVSRSPKQQEEQQQRQQLDAGFHGELCADQPLTARVEALLIASDRPLTEGRIAEVIGISGKGASKQIVTAIEELNAHYDKSGRAFRAERLAGGWQILTAPAFGPVLHRLHTERQQAKLSQPALETLAIIAYRQPIMRAEIEAIRGVASGEVLRGLMERRLIKITGRAEELGRPMLYGTTKEFLKIFGLSGLDDLPQVKGLELKKPEATKRGESENRGGTSAKPQAAGDEPIQETGGESPK